jgi:ATP-dependent RNA helicase DDX24/MAK5
MKVKETNSKPKLASRGTFQRKGIKIVGKWKQVTIDPNLFADGQMDDLVCFEELTDYRLVKNPSRLFSSEETKKRKAQAVSEEEEEEEGQSSSPKKKIKLKKQRDAARAAEGAAAQNEYEVKASEPEAQGEVTACSDQKVGGAKSESLAQAAPRKKKNKGKKKLDTFQSTSPKLPKKSKKTWMAEVHDQKADVSAWRDLFVPKAVLRALSFLGFSAPTPIQALTLAPAIRDKLDILGAAETGKGCSVCPRYESFWIQSLVVHRLRNWERGLLGM